MRRDGRAVRGCGRTSGMACSMDDRRPDPARHSPAVRSAGLGRRGRPGPSPVPLASARAGGPDGAGGRAGLCGLPGRRRRDRRLAVGLAEHPDVDDAVAVAQRDRGPGRRCGRGGALQAGARGAGINRRPVHRTVRPGDRGRASGLPVPGIVGPDLRNPDGPAVGHGPGRRRGAASGADLRIAGDARLPGGLCRRIGAPVALGHAAQLLRPVHLVRGAAVRLGIPQALSNCGGTVQSVPPDQPRPDRLRGGDVWTGPPAR